MRALTTELTVPTLLHRATEHLTDRWAGVFFPELVHRCVARAHAGLASTARVHTHLGPIAVHAAGNRLAALARAKGAASAPVRQVLFIDAHDTGLAAIAAGLLAHHAGTAVVTCSAGIDPGTAVDPFAVEVLAQHGTEPAGLAPKPVAEEVLRAADWVIRLGVGEALPLPPGLTAQDWPVEVGLDEAHGRALVADLDARVQALWVEITSSAAAWPITSGRAPGS
ncbi:low molecular weight phosphatase family protein [Kocuria sp. CPCC 205263]|uniref:low molecular weight phosphatase family protein n=1 Tax=Kocuria sp. CPCC 205263 TaxID=3073555 RepID=UPI0034D63943